MSGEPRVISEKTTEGCRDFINNMASVYVKQRSEFPQFSSRREGFVYFVIESVNLFVKINEGSNGEDFKKGCIQAATALMAMAVECE